MSIYHVKINGVQKEVTAATTSEAVTLVLACYDVSNEPDQCLDTANLSIQATYAGEDLNANSGNYLEIGDELLVIE